MRLNNQAQTEGLKKCQSVNPNFQHICSNLGWNSSSHSLTQAPRIISNTFVLHPDSTILAELGAKQLRLCLRLFGEYQAWGRIHKAP